MDTCVGQRTLEMNTRVGCDVVVIMVVLVRECDLVIMIDLKSVRLKGLS